MSKQITRSSRKFNSLLLVAAGQQELFREAVLALSLPLSPSLLHTYTNKPERTSTHGATWHSVPKSEGVKNKTTVLALQTCPERSKTAQLCRYHQRAEKGAEMNLSS